MFDRDFYPTPDNVIAKMLEGINLSKGYILEPSAGKGNIVDFIYARNLEKINPNYTGEIERTTADLHRRIACIEKNRDLQNMLRGKGYSVVDTDFLSHSPERHYDLIVMNPPFSQGVKHLLTAIDMANGAEIRCLLPKSVLENTWSSERQVLDNHLRVSFGSVVDLGQCFMDAERKTSVDVVLIRIPAKERTFKFEFHGANYGEKLYTVADISNNQVESTDVFQSMVNRFNMIKEGMHKVYEGLAQASFYAKGFVNVNIHELVGHSGGCGDGAYSNFMASIRQSAWQSIFNQTKLAGLVTSSVRKDLEDSQNQLSRMNFTYENLYSLMQDLVLSLDGIRQQCITSAFDILTGFSSDNKLYVDGWKTNDAWMIKRKIIVPYGNKDDARWVKQFPDSKPGLASNKYHKIADIEKALCFLSDKQFEKIEKNTLSGIRYFPSFHDWHETEFFMVKFFKKGTIHLEFRDDALWQKFNLEACKCKNWLPADYGRSTTQK